MNSKAVTLYNFERLENQKTAFIQQFSKCTSVQLHRRFENDQWSIAEVVSHLVIAETLSKKYFDKKLENRNHAHTIGFMSSLRRRLINGVLLLPLKYKAPMAVLNPPADVHFNSAVTDWQHIRAAYKNNIDRLEASDFELDLFLHPLVGKMKLKDAFLFMYEHTHHHQHQIDRIMNHPNFDNAV